MTGQQHTPSTLRALVQDGGVVVPGAHDALTAVLARNAGFPAVYLSGFAFEATQLGAPDMALSTLSEIVQHAARIVSATGSHLICDVDTGFGGPNNVHRTVREFQRAGVSAIQIEDQAEPKRCPFLGERKVVDRRSAAARIRIAVQARVQSDLMIIARSDADEVSKDEVVERCRIYAAEGADLVLPMVRNLDGVALTERTPAERMDVYAELVARIGHPIVALDPPPTYTAQDLLAVGVAMVILPLAPLEAAVSASIDYYAALSSDGHSEAYFQSHPRRLPATQEMMRVLGLDAYLARDAMLD